MIKNYLKYFSIKREIYDAYKLPNLLTNALNENFEKSDILVEKYKQKIFKSPEKEKEFISNKNIKFQIPRPVYKGFLEKGMLGEAVKLSLDDKEIYLIGTVYNRINLSNLYKILNFTKPDLILVQMRPDKILSNIDYYIKNNKLESKFDKLIRKPYEIQPSLSYKLKSREILKKDGILISGKPNNNEILEKYITIDNSERLTPEAVSMISLWGEEKNVPILTSDFPEILLIENIANKYSLIQIRQFFQETFIQFPNNPDFEPRTSLGTAINLYPEVFVSYSDFFISHTLKKLNNHKKIVAFVGYGQASSIPLYINYDMDRNNMTQILSIPDRYNNLITGEDSLEIMTEKWCLLFCIINGVNNTITSADKAVSELIKKYVRDDSIKTGFNQENYMIDRVSHLFDSLIIEKKEIALQFIGEGYQLKKKEFMKKIFDNPFYNSQLL